MADVELNDLSTGIRLRTGRFHDLRIRMPEGDRVVIHQPKVRHFMPHRVSGPNTIKIHYQIVPQNSEVEVTIEVHDKDGAQVHASKQKVRDTGAGLDFEWNGKDKVGYVDTRKSPFGITIKGTRAGKPLKGVIHDGAQIRQSEGGAGPVSVVAVPLVDRGWVVSRSTDTEPLTTSGKIVAHDARPEIVGVVRAIVKGVRAPERGKTYRDYFVLQKVAPSDIRIEGDREPGRIQAKPWNAELFTELELHWQKVLPLGLHSPIYRPHQRETRMTSHGEFTNVMSNGPTEGKWVGLDVIEYAHHAAGTGLAPTADNDPGTVRWRFDIDYKLAQLALGEAERPGSYGKRSTTQTSATKAVSGLDKDSFSTRLSGASERIHRISRRGASAVKMLSFIELYRRVPWIYGSIGRQTDAFIGYDCADLATGAGRKAGLTEVEYTNANNLCKTYSKLRMEGKNFYLDGNKLINAKTKKAEDVPFGGSDTKAAQLGDIVFFDWQNNNKWDHTTVLWENAGTTISRDTKLVWAHHDRSSTDGFYVGTLGELIGSDKNRVFTLRYF